MCNQNGQSRPPAFDRIKNFDHHDLTAKHCYFGCSRSPDVDGIKIFDKDDQATNIKIKMKEQLIPSTSGDLEHLKDRAQVKQQLTWSIGSVLYSTNSRGML